MKLVTLIKVHLNETNSKVRIGNNLSETLSLQTGLKQGDDLSPFLFNFTMCHQKSPTKSGRIQTQ